MRLKSLLRKYSIQWSPESPARSPDTQLSTPARPLKRMTRSLASRAVAFELEPRLPTLPVEIQLKILEMALTSKYPILDPLSKFTKENTTPGEKFKHNQIAIGFLATCKAYRTEGSRFFWRNNEFVFTSHHALRKLADVDLEHRKMIKSITLRIIAKYYDDARRNRTVRSNVPGKKITIKVAQRVHENPLARKGYKSYSWLQVVDFLDALRPPFDPRHKKKSQPRSRLLPQLVSMRIDLVNFPQDYLNMPDIDLHRMAVHDLGCTLNELVVTGVPEDDSGGRALSDLTGMVRDDGLAMKCTDTFISDGSALTRMPDRPMEHRVVRAWKPLAEEIMQSGLGESPHEHGHHHHPDVAPAPLETDHPESMFTAKKTIWRRVPTSRDANTRNWVEFSRTFGLPVDPDEEDIDESFMLFCEGCGEVHEPMSDHEV